MILLEILGMVIIFIMISTLIPVIFDATSELLSLVGRLISATIRFVIRSAINAFEFLGIMAILGVATLIEKREHRRKHGRSL